MNLEQLFRQLYPTKTIPELSLKYSGHFKAYNANVSITKFGRTIIGLTFSLSKELKECDDSIQAGVIHHLLNKAYKTKLQTQEQEFYHNFIKHVGRYTKTKESDPLLIELFHELNEEYFHGMMDQPTMVFVGENTATMGKYHYASDTVTMSSILKEQRLLLKFVLYHELLHKKHGFSQGGSKTYYHTKAFRDDEKRFADPDIERKLNAYVRHHRQQTRNRRPIFKLW